MPWTPEQAASKTHYASSPASQQKWAAIANGVLKKTGDDASAIRIANASVHYGTKKKPNAGNV